MEQIVQLAWSCRAAIINLICICNSNLSHDVAFFNGYYPCNYFAQYTGMLLFWWILRYHRITLFWGMWFLLCTFPTIWTSGTGYHLLTKQSLLTGRFFGPRQHNNIIDCSLRSRFSKQLLPFSSKGMLSMQTQCTIMITGIPYSF